LEVATMEKPDLDMIIQSFIFCAVAVVVFIGARSFYYALFY